MALKDNKHITAKEINLLKGNFRRTFSRSELRAKVLDAAEVKYHDPKRPRVTRWCRCSICSQPSARYTTVVDHKDPVVPIGVEWKDMDLNDAVNRMWCDPANLQAVCEDPCHKAKSKAEAAQRKSMKTPKKRRSKR